MMIIGPTVSEKFFQPSGPVMQRVDEKSLRRMLVLILFTCVNECSTAEKSGTMMHGSKLAGKTGIQLMGVLAKYHFPDLHLV